MLSIETAKALQEAGLKWEPQKGDKYWLPCPENAPDWMQHSWPEWVKDGVIYGSDYHYEELDAYGMQIKPEVVWIPHLDQLLAEIEKRGGTWMLHTPNNEGKYSIDVGDDVGEETIMADTPEEAAAKALLWILKAVGLKDADAFLKAAAPDMYEALRWIVKNLTTDEIELAREVWGNTNTRIILEAVEAGRQALAKAKGMD